jgi:hypothetical protein
VTVIGVDEVRAYEQKDDIRCIQMIINGFPKPCASGDLLIVPG